MQLYEMTSVGLDNEHRGMPCGDYADSFQWNGVSAQACVDGDCGACAEEARRLSGELAQFLAMYYHALCAMPDEQLATELLRLIRAVQAELPGMPVGSMLVGAAMDARTHTYLGVALGDGVLLARERFSRSVSALLAPRRRPDGSACRTSEADAAILADVRIVRGRARDALLLGTNGLERVLWDEAATTISPTVGKLMTWVVESPGDVRAEFGELVYDLSLPDDACVAVMVDSQERLGDWEGRNPGTLCQRRRDARRYFNYLRWRDAGLGRKEAATRAGWTPEGGVRRINYMRAIGLD